MRDGILRCAGCGNPGDRQGNTNCDCVTTCLFIRAEAPMLVKPTAIRSEAAELRKTADRLDEMALRVEMEIYEIINRQEAAMK